MMANNNHQGPEVADWTVMVYMVADDPAGGELLDQQANRELDQIIYAALSTGDGSVSKKLKVAVQIDFRTQPDVWRRVIGDGAWVQPESDAADPATLYGFFEWVAQKCRADRYLLIFWGHSRGPLGLFTDRPFSSPTDGPFAADDPLRYVAQTLTLKELRTALRTAREALNQKVNIIAFKDCFMSTLETAFELEDAADYLIASPGIVPIEGWPYREMFSHLVHEKTNDPKVIATKIIGALKHHYEDPCNRHSPKLEQVSFSLLDTSKLVDVSEPLRAIAKALAPETGNKGKGLRDILHLAKRSDPALLDVKVLCERLKQKDPDLEQATKSLETALHKVVVRRVVVNLAPKSQKGSKKRVGQSIGSSANGEFGGVSVFSFPVQNEGKKRKKGKKANARESVLAPNASRSVYADFALSKATRWDAVATREMPPDSAPAPSAAVYQPGELLPLVLKQLQR